MIASNTAKTRWSERRQVATIVMLAGLVIFLLWFFLLLPQTRKRQQLKVRVEEATRQLQRNNYLLGEDLLRAKLARENERYQELDRIWAKVPGRLSVFSPEEHKQAETVGHIDFKVALYQVRQRLQQKARTVGVSLPDTLGMSDAVTGDEKARRLMLQLRGIEKIVDLAMDLGIQRIQSVAPQPVMERTVGPLAQVFLEEYPIKLAFRGSTENLYDLIRAFFQPANAFSVKQLKIEREPTVEPDAIDVALTVSALTFVRGPEDLARPKVERLLPVTPRGY